MRCAMPPTTPERYAVVSCHVERPLDDRVWAAFAALQERRPGGLAIAALLRPPDAEAGEHDDELWLERAREAASRGPLGHHTHFTSPTHARPTGGDPSERVRREGAWLPSAASRRRSTAEAVGTSTAVSLRPARSSATPTARRAWHARPTSRREPPGPSWTVPHGSSSTARPSARCRPRTAQVISRVRSSVPGLAPRVHAYFHDTDLVEPRRRALIVAALAVLGRRRPATDLDAVASATREDAPVVAWSDVARGEAADARA